MRSFHIKLLSIIAIAVLGTLVYSNTFYSSFHFDDGLYIVHNLYIKNFQGLFHHWNSYPDRFITFLSLAVNYHFNGLNVIGYHVVNLAIHLGAAILVWWLTWLTLSTPAMKEDRITRHANEIALFAGLVFVSQPVQTEAVTYIWQRTASMMALFYILSLSLYVQSRLIQVAGASAPLSRQLLLRGRCYYILSLVAFMMAMFTKENAITLPLMVLFYEFSFFGTKRIFNDRLCIFFLLWMIIFIIRLVEPSPQLRVIEQLTQGGVGTSPWHYLLTQFNVITTYIRLLFLPIHQTLDYDYPISKNIFELPTFVSFLFLAGILCWARSLFLKYRLLAFSIGWFFVALSLESSILPLKNIIFEHRLYLPMMGYSLFLVSGAYYLFGKKNIKAMRIILAVIVAGYSILTYERNKVWRDEVTLWDDAVQKSPHKDSAYNNRGYAYLIKGNLTQAIVDYNKAIDINPRFADAYLGRGLCYSKQGNLARAIDDYDRAIDIEDHYKAIGIDHHLRAYTNRGIFYFHQGHLAQAISDLTKAIELDHSDDLAYYNLGLSYAQENNFPQAIADYNKAIEIDPDDRDAYYNRGRIFAEERYFTEAIFDFNKVIALNPNDADAYNNRGITYAYQGDLEKAISNFNQAIKINPKDMEARHNLATALSLKGHQGISPKGH